MLFDQYYMILVVMLSVGILIAYWMTTEEELDSNHPNYKPFMISRLPMAFALFIPLSFIILGKQTGLLNTSIIVFNTMVMIMIYYPILYFILDHLRSHFQARTVAFLWTLPNVTYFIYYAKFTAIGASYEPLLRICLPEKIMIILLSIWAVGFIGVLGYYIVEHFRFKHEIKKNSKEVDDAQIIEVFEKVKEELGCEKKYLKVSIDPDLNTPLSFSNQIVLDNSNYTSEELYLIFKHEMIHISREDPAYKFLMVFCKALCWFNPFVWKCLRKSEDDMELSCDEAVVKNCDEQSRKKYASLILSTAGDERGFTTCLSANGKALKYRLSHVLHDSKKKVGYPVLFALMVLVLFGSGLVSAGISNQQFNHTVWSEVQGVSFASCNEEICEDSSKIQLVEEYLNTLDLNRIEKTEIYDGEYIVSMIGDSEEATYYLHVYDHLIIIEKNSNSFDFPSSLLNTQDDYQCYYVKDQIDEEYIQNLLA